VAIALNLVPFAGIAFLWFVGVLRDRIGAREDRFFATVFLGSGRAERISAHHGNCARLIAGCALFRGPRRRVRYRAI
jgi:hypothetical protein